MTWFDNVDFSKVTVKHRWNGMAGRFDVEQGILSCWHVTGDVDLLYKQVMDGSPTTDEIANALLGIKSLYDMRFNALFADFEDTIGNDWMKEKELKRQLDAKQAKIDELMLEYCPDEVTKDQWDEYSKHQVAVDANEMFAQTACKNLDLIIKGVAPFLDKKFVDVKTDKEYTFIGIIVGSDDYYYGMYSKSNGLVSLSCVGSIESFGFELIE